MRESSESAEVEREGERDGTYGTYNELRDMDSGVGGEAVRVIEAGPGADVGVVGSGMLKYSNSCSIAFRLTSFVGSCRVPYIRKRMMW